MSDADTALDNIETTGEERLITAFERHDEFVELLKKFLSVDLLADPFPAESAAEERTLNRLTAILDEYQELAYLLDAFLEELVGPPIEALRTYARIVSRTEVLGPKSRLEALAKLIYWYTKTRGYKTIVRYFPHETADFSLAVGLLSKTLSSGTQWELTYVLLLWMSLICMLPFDLSLFDVDGKETVSARVERIGLDQLSKAGKERDAAAVLLSKLYIRKDAQDRITPFLVWGTQVVQRPENDYTALGVLQVISELLKSGTQVSLSGQLFDTSQILHAVRMEPSLMRNTLIRKYCSKISGRLGVMQLPPRKAGVRRAARPIDPAAGAIPELVSEMDESDLNVPEDLDEHIEELVAFLQDKDTIVRYSAAKGLARISERLPSDFTAQVLDTILGLYSIHEGAVREQEYVPDAEGTWHGATLACAEFARRGLIDARYLGDVLDWASKALLFDIRRGAVSVGSNVRDAAAYVLWASARSQSTDTMRPWAESLAQRLVAVAVFDREIHIRRAASAAFQENVGRLNLFPHGIDVLTKMDFYAVSIRRHAFEMSAPEVAEHLEYRRSLLDHLETITLRHWDPQMRAFAADTCRRICELDLENLSHALAVRQEKLLTLSESSIVHGALLTLSALAEALSARDSESLQRTRLQIFRSLSSIPLAKLHAFRGDMLLSAACTVLATSVSRDALNLGASGPLWKDILEIGVKSRDDSVQDAAADAWASISGIVDCSEQLESTWTIEFPRATPIMQQGIAKALGRLSYNVNHNGLEKAVQCLSDAITSGSPTFAPTIEVRRDCFVAMHQIVCHEAVVIPFDERKHLFQLFLRNISGGLADYSTDQRGDVGSWIRTTCLRALGTVIPLLFKHADGLRDPSGWLDNEQLPRFIGLILKQGVERLDNVRDEAGNQLGAILLAYGDKSTTAPAIWKIDGREALQELCTHEDDRTWKEGSWFLPKVVQLLHIRSYRANLLEGLVYSIGSKMEGTLGPAGKALAEFSGSLTLAAQDASEYTLCQLGRDLLSQARRNSSNNTYFIPYLQTFVVLLQADALQRLAEVEEGNVILRDVVALASRNVAKLKSVQRIIASMNIVACGTAIPTIAANTLDPLMVFLTHYIPKVRSAAAESLYMVSQTGEIFGENEERGEELLLEIPWLTGHEPSISTAAREVVDLIKQGLE